MMPTIEDHVQRVVDRHKLSGVHIFKQSGDWQVFGYRKHARGYQASTESSTGQTISDAIDNMDARLIEGPIHKKETP